MKITLAVLAIAVLLLGGAAVTGTDNDAKNDADAGNSAVSASGEVSAENGGNGEAQGAGEVSANDEGAAPVIDKNDEYLVLINRTHTVGSDYVPADLVVPKYYADRSYEGYRKMRQVAADAYDKLVEGAKAAGYDIRLTSAYRSYYAQETLYNNYVAKDGQAAADRYSARPGTSEHQSGLTADVSAASVNWRLTQDFANTNEGKWLAEHAHEYGFIIRFPEGKEDITGYMYEPWHIRYVGLEHAKVIYEQQTTLEEYLGETE